MGCPDVVFSIMCPALPNWAYSTLGLSATPATAAFPGPQAPGQYLMHAASVNRYRLMACADDDGVCLQNINPKIGA